MLYCWLLATFAWQDMGQSGGNPKGSQFLKYMWHGFGHCWFEFVLICLLPTAVQARMLLFSKSAHGQMKKPDTLCWQDI